MIVAFAQIVAIGSLDTPIFQYYPDLARDTLFYLLQELAEKTVAGYISKFKIFLKFLIKFPRCRKHPLSEQTLMLYASFRARSVRVITIRADFSAIASLLKHTHAHLNWSKSHMPRLHGVLNGIERHQVSHPPNSLQDQIKPLTFDLLQQFLKMGIF